MNPDRQQAINYLRAPANGFWRWADDGAVLVWRDGTTVAFRQEMVQIIQVLAPGGLPPFGAIVFLLAACRGKLPAVADLASAPDAPLPAAMNSMVLRASHLQLRVQLEAAVGELARVSKLPAELNAGMRAKCLLAEAVFEPAKVERHVVAAAVLNGLREPMNDAELVDPEPGPAQSRYLRQISIVADGLKRHTAESLALRLRTGLDALPQEVDANLPSAERARRLIEELSRDRELGVVARAARELLAAVRLPRRLGERDQLALGGVSDITNRGPLDRLLLSELAHDDLTLAVRVALNEALYLRREPPLREPPAALALLLDSGVRLWGVPRVLATAVALAFIARDKQHRQILAWRSHGRQLQPLDLLSRTGLTQHLGALETSAHAGESVPAFADAVSDHAQNQSVLITHRDALADPEFRRALADHPAAPGFVATVDRDGRFELHALPLAHRPPLCEADLDLKAVFEEAVVPLVKIEADPNLPAIFSTSPFPFLLPLTGKVNFWVAGADGLFYAVLDDRRLARFGNQQSGARILACELPSGATLWMDADGAEVHAVKLGSRQRPAPLLSLALPYGQLRVMDLVSGPEIQAVHRCDDALVVIRRHDVRAYSLGDGRLLSQATNPHLWIHGRFFRGLNHFYFTTWDGERVKFEPVTMPATYLASSIVTLFDRHGLAGPWILCKNGHVVCTESGEIIKIPNPPDLGLNFNLPIISRNGHRVLIPTNKKNTRGQPLGSLLDLNQKSVHDLTVFSSAVLNKNPPLPVWNVFHQVDAFAVLADGFAFCGRKNHWRMLELKPDGKLRISLLQPEAVRPLAIQKIPGQTVKTKQGCALRAAALGTGSKVFFDSRGLVHLKSADLNLPEVSIILADGEVAGWTSDGCVCGPAFFFDGPYTADPAAVFARLMKIIRPS